MTRDAGDVVILRHGAGRGRLPNYFRTPLGWLREHHPATHARLRFAYTGEGDPDLDGVATVVCWLADPLRELYPACHGDAMRLTERARARSIPVINPPEALSNTIKSRQAALWQEAGVPTPRHLRFETLAELWDVAQGFEYPFIIRSDLLHSQVMWMCETARDLRRLQNRLDGRVLPGAVAEFVDTRWPVGSGSRAWSELFHKKRTYVLGGVVRTNHIFFSHQPVVAEKSSIFVERTELPWWRRHGPWRTKPKHVTVDGAWWAEELARNPHRRSDFELWEAAAQLDVAFWESETEHESVMTRAADALGLDFMAIDYATCADGTPVLWEANPYFHLPEPRHPMSKERRTAERRETYYGAFAAFLERCTFVNS